MGLPATGDSLNLEVAEAMPGGVAWVSADGRVAIANAEARRFLGLVMEDTSQVYVADFRYKTICPDGSDFPVEEYPVSRCLATGQPQGPELIGVRRPDGQVCWGIFSAVPRKDAHSEQSHGAIVTFLDVTQRKLAEDELRESELRFRQLAEAIDGVFWMVDSRTQQRLYVSPAYERIWGRSCHSLYESPDSFLHSVHPEDRSRIISTMRPVTGKAFEVEYRILLPDGSVRWIHDRAFPIRNERGEVYRLCGIAEDVTERRRAQEELRAMNERLEQLVAHRTDRAEEQSRILRSVLQSMGDAVIVADRNGTVFLTNPAAERIAGPARPDPHSVESCAEPARLLRADGKTPYLGPDLPLARAVHGEHVDGEEMLIARPDRPEGVWISATARPLRDEGGAPAGGVLVARDVTEQRRSQHLIRESERHYRELAERNRRLVQELEHRVRNNLAGLIGLVSIMRERTMDVPSFAIAIEGRLRAMAHVQQLLAKTEWDAPDLRLLVASTLSSVAPMSPCHAELTLDGPDARVNPKQVLPLALILVEWFTNSCKYGAHSQSGGNVRVRWDISGNGDGRVRLNWTERGGPPIAGDVRPSLGTELVHSFATRELGGRCSMCFPAAGAEHELEFDTGHME